MQATLSRIEARASAVSQHAFVRWLADEGVPAQQRLSAWLPEAAFFVFGFRDLNAEVLRYSSAEAAACPLKRAINRHLAEDATHWPWYLQDLRTLGLDRELTLSSALRFLWGRDTAAQRRALYRLCALAGQAQAPALRYALIAALEAVAHRLFVQLVEVSRAYEAATGARLVYLGPHHLERETGHLSHQADGDDALFSAIVLDDSDAASAWAIAEEVITLVEARWTEFHRVALARLSAAAAAAAAPAAESLTTTTTPAAAALNAA